MVSLRIFIRELLSLDAPELKGQASVDYKKIKEIRNLLPAYCKPSVIKEKLGQESDIFIVSFKDDVVRFQIDTEFIPKNEKLRVHDEYARTLEKFIWEFNQNVAYVNSGGICPDYLNDFFSIKNKKSAASFKPMLLTEIEIDDLASLSVHYSYDIVVNALSVVYREYYMYQKTVNNLGGLVSTIIRSEFNKSKKAA